MSFLLNVVNQSQCAYNCVEYNADDCFPIAKDIITINDNMSFLETNDIFSPITAIKEELFSVEISDILQVINNVVLSALVSLFGIVANAINMMVFYRQGFNTTTNISFFAMAISDMGCLITIQWNSICLNPYLETADINFDPKEILYLAGDWFHLCFGRVTSWITVFVTTERFLGITLPLKIKQIITLRKTIIIICFVFIINFSVLVPEYTIGYWDWKFFPAKNRTLFGLVYRSYKDQAYGLVYTLTFISGMVSFILVLLLTLLLVVNLERKSKWRQKATGGTNNYEAVTTRDKKTIKMIITIACVLIVCYFPGVVLSLVPLFEPEFDIGGAYVTSCYGLWSVACLFETVNSSVNIFLYYAMSTKYRQNFNELFPRWVKLMHFSVDSRVGQ